MRSFALPNGLAVVVNSDHASPMVAVSITYKVGSQDERPGLSGFAHLFEHLMAQGTKSLKPREISELVEANGGTRNAFTTRTNTTYHSLVPRGALETLLWAESERMHSLNVDARALALEQQVVLEERRLRYEDAAYRLAQDQRMAEAAFSRWENRHTTIGEAADVRDAKLADVQAFYNAHYAPNNAVVALAGDVTLEQAQALMSRYFGPIAAKPVPPRPDLSEAPMAADTATRVEDPHAKTPRVMAAWHGPARDSRDFWALTILSELLSGQDGNPLYRELVLKNASALSAGSNFPWWTSHNMRRGNPDLFGLIMTPLPGVAAATLVDQAQRVIERFSASGPTGSELARVKAGIERQWIEQMDFLLDRAQLLSTYAALVGPIENLWRDLKTLLSVTHLDVAEAARRWLVGRPRAIVEIVPGQPRPPAPPEASTPLPEAAPRPEGDPRPEPQATPAPSVPGLTRFVLSNGLKVIVVHDAKLPAVQIRLSLKAGRTAERAGEEALSLAATSLMRKGAAGQSARQLAERFAALGYELSTRGHSEALHVDAMGLSRNAGAFLQELSALLTSPAYPDEEIALWKKKSLERLKGLQADPDFMAGERLKSELFAGHPYGKPYPSAAQLEAVTGPALRAFHARRVVPNGAALVLAGDVDAQAARVHLEAALSRWTGRAPKKAMPALPAGGAARLALVDRPGSSQATLVIAQALALTSKHPDYAALEAANQILGGSATGRLFLNLRVDKGYTYGAYSGLEPRAKGVIFSAEAQVRNGVAAAALVEMRREIARLRDEEVPAAQLAAAKKLLLGRFMMRLASTDRLADTLIQLNKEGRDPASELNSYAARLDALTPRDVQRVARQYLEPARMVTVVVGDERALKGPLSAPQEWSVYIARCADDSLYTGIAKDVSARLANHNAGRGAAYTRSRRPVTLAYLERGLTRSQALVREAQIKSLPRPAKEQLLTA